MFLGLPVLVSSLMGISVLIRAGAALSGSVP